MNYVTSLDVTLLCFLVYQSSSESAKISSKSRREVKNTEDQNTEHRDVDSVTEHKRQINVREE